MLILRQDADGNPDIETRRCLHQEIGWMLDYLDDNPQLTPAEVSEIRESIRWREREIAEAN